jgi:hypothetical protein
LSSDARALARRRAELVARSTELRAEIAAAGGSLQERLAPAERLVAAARAHPLLTTLAAGAGALAVGRLFPSLFRVLRFALFLIRL